MATKATIITSVLTEIGRADLSTPADEWFDDSYQTVLSYKDWAFLTSRATRATVAGTYRYALPIDFRKVYALYLDTGAGMQSRKLRFLSLQEFTRRYPRVEDTAAGWSTDYTIYDNNIQIAPKPSAVWTMNLIYCFDAPNITSGQTPVIPDRWLNSLRIGIRARAYSHVREYEKSDKNYQLFTEYLEMMAKDEDDYSGDELFLRPFGASPLLSGEYWNDPAIMRVP